VNTAIANAILALEHTPAKKGKETMTKGEMASYVKGVLEENSARDITHITQQVREDVRGNLINDLQEFKQDIVAAAKSYTDNLTEKLKLELDTQFETMMMTLNTTRKMLNGDTPTRPALPTPHNSPN
jgi:hemerythrin-like domain-containing protein